MAIRKNKETNAVLTRLNSELQQQLKVGSCSVSLVWLSVQPYPSLCMISPEGRCVKVCAWVWTAILTGQWTTALLYVIIHCIVKHCMVTVIDPLGSQGRSRVPQVMGHNSDSFQTLTWDKTHLNPQTRTRTAASVLSCVSEVQLLFKWVLQKMLVQLGKKHQAQL